MQPLVLSPNAWMWKPWLPGRRPVISPSTTTGAASPAWENLMVPFTSKPRKQHTAFTAAILHWEKREIFPYKILDTNPSSFLEFLRGKIIFFVIVEREFVFSISLFLRDRKNIWKEIITDLYKNRNDFLIFFYVEKVGYQLDFLEFVFVCFVFVFESEEKEREKLWLLPAVFLHFNVNQWKSKCLLMRYPNRVDFLEDCIAQSDPDVCRIWFLRKLRFFCFVSKKKGEKGDFWPL